MEFFLSHKLAQIFTNYFLWEWKDTGSEDSHVETETMAEVGIRDAR